MATFLSKSLLKQLERDNKELHEVVNAINNLYRMARFKLSFVNKMLQGYKQGMLFHEEAFSFLQKNIQILESLKNVQAIEKTIQQDATPQKVLFSHELIDIATLLNKDADLKEVLEKENALLHEVVTIAERDYHDPKRLDLYDVMQQLASLSLKEVELLSMELKITAKVKANLSILQEKVEKSKKLPVITSTFYHASSFIFNVGDVLRPYVPRSDPDFQRTEQIYEEVRKKNFPDKPSRFNCVFVTRDPHSVQIRGIVYAVKVEGKVHDTSQDAFQVSTILSDSELRYWANVYWGYERQAKEWYPETLVEGKVTITGLADYIRSGDMIQTIRDTKDDEGKWVPKGSKGVIQTTQAHDLPFYVKMEDGKEFALLPGTFILIQKAA